VGKKTFLFDAKKLYEEAENILSERGEWKGASSSGFPRINSTDIGR
jgi:hypothetical protein